MSLLNLQIKPEIGSHSRFICFCISIMFENDSGSRGTRIFPFSILKSTSQAKTNSIVHFDKQRTHPSLIMAFSWQMLNHGSDIFLETLNFEQVR